jgi:phosphoribosylaminoimidazole-succinocarboxamide synthase
VTSTLLHSSIQSLPLLARGKVRDMYAVGDDKLLIVTSDRLSAFDVILDDPIPGKGEVLNSLTNFWLKRLSHIIPTHETDVKAEDVVTAEEREQVVGRAVVVKRLKPIMVEAVARGYLIGSGWKDYQATGSVCGIPLPAGLKQAQKLPEPIFTPAAKAEMGDHDENVSFDHVIAEVGLEMAEKIRSITLQIYREASEYAASRGIIIADTKFEFGLDEAGTLYLMDEVLTPDSSRFWPADTYQEGTSPPSFDKQFVRDYLETQDWGKTPPAPRLPADVIAGTAAKYREALDRLVK